MKIITPRTLPLLLVASACSGGRDDFQPPGEVQALTCEILMGDSCYKRALAEVRACAPGAAVHGAFDRNEATCQMADARASFAQPYDAKHRGVAFRMESDGAFCVEIESLYTAGIDLSVTTASGRVHYAVDEEVRLQCPDGITYVASALDLLECDGEGPHVPGTASAQADGFFSFGLLGSGLPDPVHVVTCETTDPK